jgi:tRNA nucleotidyltransferase/poly(A) polymerase
MITVKDFVDLISDSSRRDLTINSMALDENTGIIIDPFNGRQDLEDKILRHVSPAFAEDPLRVLRVARFAARYPDFKIDKRTMELMKEIVQNGELEHLSKERIVAEFEKAFSEKDPIIFLGVLVITDALNVIFPELDKFLDSPSYIKIVTFVPKLKTVTERLAYIFTMFERDVIVSVCEKMKFPNSVRDLALDYKRFEELYDVDSKSTVELFDEFRVSHDSLRFWTVFYLWTTVNQDNMKNPDRATDMMNAYSTVTVKELSEFIVHLKGRAIGDFLKKERISKIDNLFSNQ